MRRQVAVVVLVSLVSLVSSAAPLAAQTVASAQDRREALQHYRTGQELLSGERWEQAAEAFQAAIDRDPLFTDAYYGLGRAYLPLERWASAVQAFEDCIAAARSIHGLRERDRVAGDQLIDDEIKELRENLRRAQSLRGGAAIKTTDIERRIRDLEKNRSSLGQPFQPPAAVLLSLGSAHFRAGETEAAEAAWRQAVAVDARLGEAWNNLAVIYLRTGRKAEATDAVERAERAGFRVHPQLKEDIRNMKSGDLVIW
ncbi:MAG: tetratricopeptide repeat protein [Vicinamibacterales bacterium]